jgi:hypothetical protein
MSVIITSVNEIMPPAPIPCRLRPTSMTVKLFETAAMIAPTVKKVKATNTKGFRPKIWENEA